MLELILDWFERRRQRREYEDFCNRWGFSIVGDHFTIGHGMVGIVSEYGYLLRAYTDGAHDGFHRFDAIAADSAQIDARLARDLRVEIPLEQQRLGIARETARGNLNRLRLAIACIAEYVSLVHKLDKLKLPLNPLPAPPAWI